jgi:hypothetical protein
VQTWTAWSFAIALLTLAAYDYFKWGEFTLAVQLTGGAAVIALITMLRGRGLKRKKEALRIATQDYEDTLRRPG